LRSGVNVAIFAGSGGVASARQTVMHHEFVKRRASFVLFGAPRPRRRADRL